MSNQTPSASSPAKTVRGAAKNFVGTAWVSLIAPPGNPTDCVVGYVTFELGARINWHAPNCWS